MRSPQSPQSETRRTLPWWKKCCFAFVTVAIGFAGVELTLWAIGVDPVTSDEDPFVGFSSNSPLLERKGKNYSTRPAKLSHFNAQTFPAQKTEDTQRIFCLGGSTTYVRPYDDRTSFAGWLREILPAADPQQNWEVINGGGISYASYRVSNVVEEVLNYSPDLLIIYTGHNEFLEQRTYPSLYQVPASLTSVLEFTSRTRTFSAMRQMFNLPNRNAEQRALLPGEAETILDQSVGLDAYSRDNQFRSHVVEHFRFNLRRIVRMAARHGVPVIFVTPASNLRDCSPFKSEFNSEQSSATVAELNRLLVVAKEMIEQKQFSDAAEALKKFLQVEPQFADAYFLNGQIQWQLGNTDAARENFQRALIEDVCPLRALPEIIEAVKDIADELDVPCVDFVEEIGLKSEHQTPGNDWFLDHVHPTIDGHRLLAEKLLDQMIAIQLVQPTSDWNAEVMETIATRMESRLSDEDRGIALRNLSKVLGWAGKLDEAGRLSDMALELAPQDPETQLQAGIVAEDRNDLSTAEERYREATRLQPDFLAAHLNLGVALARQDRLEEAREEFRIALKLQPQSAQILANLSMVEFLLENFPAAEEYQQQAVQLAEGSERQMLLNRLSEIRQAARESQ
ncbi:Tetratricopeptide repeat protein [Thalassoglobus neptunius]|uniref:Tetratricopeptide repeat protein n=1 Tax=Thalassoglobus neptunius TaxID=1938619 RepID=A0A5C5WY76_9PLAN|nr:tetratricopeptide repeat protein [Thalassoglobus neptunius]TWT55636.1 Tetratricopeptide repeat protein [Thalassoglobus neptunius]